VLWACVAWERALLYFYLVVSGNQTMFAVTVGGHKAVVGAAGQSAAGPTQDAVDETRHL